jgi:hypothetical protein
MTVRFTYFLCLLALFAPAFYTGQTAIDITQKAVFENSFCRKTFYTWTTEEQISNLRANKTLLTKSMSETKGYSIFDLSLRDSSLKNNPAVQLLLEEQFSKKRFAWVNSWATIMGWEGESYGNQLVKIVLKDNAIIGKFNKSNTVEVLGFYNMNGQKLPLDSVLKYKNRVAAVYHENTAKKRRLVLRSRGTYAKPEKLNLLDDVPYREFVIVNENMIGQWSYGTAEIKQEIESEIELLNQFQRSKVRKQEAYRIYDTGWRDTHVEYTIQNDLDKYHLLSCFENDYYLFNPKRIKAIIKNLHSALKQQTTEIIK